MDLVIASDLFISCSSNSSSNSIIYQSLSRGNKIWKRGSGKKECLNLSNNPTIAQSEWITNTPWARPRHSFLSFLFLEVCYEQTYNCRYWPNRGWDSIPKKKESWPFKGKNITHYNINTKTCYTIFKCPNFTPDF